MQDESHPDLVKQRTDFVRLRDAGHLAQWADPAKTTTEQSATIRARLNRYELVAIGIRHNTIDEKLYKRWCRTTLVKDWIACKPFAMQLRQNAGIPTFFCDYETLAKSWASQNELPHV